MSQHPQWEAFRIGGLIYGAYLLPGYSQWRYVRESGVRSTFPTEQAAKDAARDEALNLLFPKMTSTMPKAERALAETLGIEEWLRSRREDVKKADTVHRPGRKPFVVIRGRARA